MFVWLALLYSVFLASHGETYINNHGAANIEAAKEKLRNVVERSAPSDKVIAVGNHPQEETQSSEEINRSKGIIHTDVPLISRLEPPKKKSEPYPLVEVERNITLYLNTLHYRLKAISGPTVTALKVWDTFLDVTKAMPMKWDEMNRDKMPLPRSDNSIFVSLGTYRDPYCPMTLKSLFAKSKRPDLLYVGLFQQNCFEKTCRTGVLKGGIVKDMEADVDCYKEFCKSVEGQRSDACNNNHIRLFNVNESESLGPYMARYLGAKFYRGEQYYLQIDSHSEFSEHWDAKLIKMVEDAPARKPVISTYPPDSTSNWPDSIGYRMCDSEFAKAQIEWQIIRLGSSLAFDKSVPAAPKYAPFVAAGFFFAPADFLHDVPFDPLLPWIFMGEEISMSARLWTAGYDIFSPTINVLNHYYVRRHYPKFWESVNRFFKRPIHNDIVELVIQVVSHPQQHADKHAHASPSFMISNPFSLYCIILTARQKHARLPREPG